MTMYTEDQQFADLESSTKLLKFFIYSFLLLLICKSGDDKNFAVRSMQTSTNVQQSSSNNVEIDKARRFRRCGKKLVKTLGIVCNHCYAGPSMIQRNKRDTELGYKLENELFNRLRTLKKRNASREDTTRAFDDYFAQSYDENLEYIESAVDHSKGIVAKCCSKHCGWNELKRYCCKK